MALVKSEYQESLAENVAELVEIQKAEYDEYLAERYSSIGLTKKQRHQSLKQNGKRIISLMFCLSLLKMMLKMMSN